MNRRQILEVGCGVLRRPIERYFAAAKDTEFGKIERPLSDGKWNQ